MPEKIVSKFTAPDQIQTAVSQLIYNNSVLHNHMSDNATRYPNLDLVGLISLQPPTFTPIPNFAATEAGETRVAMAVAATLTAQLSVELTPVAALTSTPTPTETLNLETAEEMADSVDPNFRF
ncbi:hypothetical protein KFU94_51095 [Chloroflexi bacterium TSY]|nr:hypothetical protein [Chloroflexi bacterium TSY]